LMLAIISATLSKEERHGDYKRQLALRCAPYNPGARPLRDAERSPGTELKSTDVSNGDEPDDG
jgi:hypothetical protein